MESMRVMAVLRTVAAAASGLAFLLTLFLRDWIEVVLPVDPDRHSGGVEWIVSAVFLGAAFAFAASARAAWNAYACHERGGLSR